MFQACGDAPCREVWGDLGAALHISAFFFVYGGDDRPK